VSERETKSPGAEPERLKIDLPFEEAVRRAMQSPIPPGGVPERKKRKRRGKVDRGRP
jgi:hypothetical protein